MSPGVNLSSGEIKHIGGSILMDSNLKVTFGQGCLHECGGAPMGKKAELSLAREASTSGSIKCVDGKSSGYAPESSQSGKRVWFRYRYSWICMVGGEGSFTNSRFYIHSIDQYSSGDHQFGRRLVLDGEKLIVGYGDSNQRKLEYYNVSSIDGNLTYHTQIVRFDC